MPVGGGGGEKKENRRSEGVRAECSLAIVFESRGAGRAEPSRAEIEIALRDSQTARINANNWILPAISVSLERRAAQLRNAPRRRLRASKVDLEANEAEEKEEGRRRRGKGRGGGRRRRRRRSVHLPPRPYESLSCLLSNVPLFANRFYPRVHHRGTLGSDASVTRRSFLLLPTDRVIYSKAIVICPCLLCGLESLGVQSCWSLRSSQNV